MQVQWPGFSDGGSLVLPLPTSAHLAPDMPPRIRMDGRELERKDELHLTLLDRKQAAACREHLGDARVRGCFESLHWAPLGMLRHALLHRPRHGSRGKPEAWTVVELLDEPALAAFRQMLARESGLAFDDGVPHVTVYVAGDPRGIGVPDAATWQARFVRDVDAAEFVRAAT